MCYHFSKEKGQQRKASQTKNPLEHYICVYIYLEPFFYTSMFEFMTLLFSNLLWDTNFHVNKQKNQIFFENDQNAQQLYMQRIQGFKKQEKFRVILVQPVVV